MERDRPTTRSSNIGSIKPTVRGTQKVSDVTEEERARIRAILLRRALAPHLGAHTLLMDVGSTKCDVIAAASQTLGLALPRFVPAHPITGKEVAGVEHADVKLYQGAQVVLTPTERTLTAHLTQLGIQSLIIIGESTSGCVRASTVDGYSHGYHMTMVEECCFDRSEISHKVNLFDLHHKYADVMHVQDVISHIEQIQH